MFVVVSVASSSQQEKYSPSDTRVDFILYFGTSNNMSIPKSPNTLPSAGEAGRWVVGCRYFSTDMLLGISNTNRKQLINLICFMVYGLHFGDTS